MEAAPAIQNAYVVREKALRLAVRTGIAPDLDFVWNAQHNEGHRMCFGSLEAACDRHECRWFDRCRVLTAEPVDNAWILQEGRLQESTAEVRRQSATDRWIPPSVRRASPAVRRSPSL